MTGRLTKETQPQTTAPPILIGGRNDFQLAAPFDIPGDREPYDSYQVAIPSTRGRRRAIASDLTASWQVIAPPTQGRMVADRRRLMCNHGNIKKSEREATEQ